jgi:uncharacterized protein (DUF1800 family)
MHQINRRTFIKHSSTIGVGALTLNLLPTQLMASSSNKATSLPNYSLMTLLLNRTGFGINDEDKLLYQQLGYEGYIDYQLNADAIDDSVIESFIADNLPTVNMSVAEIIDLIDSGEINRNFVANELKSATFLRATYSRKQLFQVMVEFWNNHFSVFHLDGPIAVLKSKEDREVIRPLALSTFSELLHADAKSPAMIVYLDTFSSTKESPNENYARELMELHTVGVDGPYTHFDIDEVARCFTGWRVNAGGTFLFQPSRHDFEEKLVLGEVIPAGGGVTDGEQVLDILASHDDTAAFISTKLCKHFISDDPDISIIESTTKTFKITNGNIKECLKHILMSKQFMTSKDLKLKRPLHFMTSAIRALDGDIFNRPAVRSTRRILEGLGQLPFNWQTPDGYPDVANHWQSTTGMLFRWNYINGFCFDVLNGYSFSLADIIQEPRTPANILLQITFKILNRNLSDADHAALLAYLDDGTTGGVVPIKKIQGALAIAMGSPYFQLL